MTTAEVVGDSGSLSTFTRAGRACNEIILEWGENGGGEITEKDDLFSGVLETFGTSKEFVKDELVGNSLDVFGIHL